MTEKPKDTSSPVLKIDGSDPRAAKYQKIASVHREIVEAKWRSRTAGVPFNLRPEIVLHLEESVAFLAEELLGTRTFAEELADSMDKLARNGEIMAKKVQRLEERA